MDNILILEARKKFHQSLIESGMWVVDSMGVPSNADVGDRTKAKMGKYNVSTLIAQKWQFLLVFLKRQAQKRWEQAQGLSLRT